MQKFIRQKVFLEFSSQSFTHFSSEFVHEKIQRAISMNFDAERIFPQNRLISWQYFKKLAWKKLLAPKLETAGGGLWNGRKFAQCKWTTCGVGQKSVIKYIANEKKCFGTPYPRQLDRNQKDIFENFYALGKNDRNINMPARKSIRALRCAFCIHKEAEKAEEESFLKTKNRLRIFFSIKKFFLDAAFFAREWRVMSLSSGKYIRAEIWDVFDVKFQV